MGFGQAFSTCMRKYADFSGRATRPEYWWFYLAVFLIELPFSIALQISMMTAMEPLLNKLNANETLSFREVMDAIDWNRMAGAAILLTIVSLALWLPSLAVGVRRLHDIGQSGWWMLLQIVGLGIVLLVMFVLDGQPKENQWGPDPNEGRRPGWGQSRAYPPPVGA